MFQFPLHDTDLTLIAEGITTPIPGLHAIPEPTNPQGKHLTRGNGDPNGKGIIYWEGYGQAIQQQFQFKSTQAFGNYLRGLYKNDTRFDFIATNRKTGATRTWPDAIFSAEPRQGAIEEGADSATITLNIECFKIIDTEA